MKRVLQTVSWIYLTGTILIAAWLLIFRYRSFGLHGLDLETAAHALFTALFWPILVVAVMRAMLGIINIE